MNCELFIKFYLKIPSFAKSKHNQGQCKLKATWWIRNCFSCPPAIQRQEQSPTTTLGTFTQVSGSLPFLNMRHPNNCSDPIGGEYPLPIISALSALNQPPSNSNPGSVPGGRLYLWSGRTVRATCTVLVAAAGPGNRCHHDRCTAGHHECMPICLC